MTTTLPNQPAFDKLVEHINALAVNGRSPVVAISGFGGSGKTTLTDQLRDSFDIADAQVIRLDNLFAPQPWGEGLYSDYDWGLVTKALEPAHEGNALIYTGRGFMGEDIQFNEPLPRIVFIEGVRLLRPELVQYFDYKVWIDCPIEIATTRGKAGDRLRGSNEAHIARWDTEWAPKDLEYFNLVYPDKLADFTYKPTL